MPDNPTVLEIKGSELVPAGPTGYAAVPDQVNAPKPFNEPMIYRPDILDRHAQEVIEKIMGYAVRLAREHMDVDDFVPETKALAPANYRRRKVRVEAWPLGGLVGKTGKSNWQNMVNKAVIAARAKIELSQNNGVWLTETYDTGYTQHGSEEAYYIDLVFVDARNAQDLEYRDGAPVKAETRREQALTAKELAGALTDAMRSAAKQTAAPEAPAEESTAEAPRRSPQKPPSLASQLPPPPDVSAKVKE